MTRKIPQAQDVLTDGNLALGDFLSCDQYISSVKGCLAHTWGKENECKWLVGVTIFIDHATGYIVNFHQSSLIVTATIERKHKCEKIFADLSINVRGYTADNHPFRSASWKANCKGKHQLKTDHFGAGAHHQILCERYIQTVFNWSMPMMIYFALH